MAAFPFFEIKKWIKKEDLWKTVEDFSKENWPEGTVPVNMEWIAEQRLGLNIVPVPSFFREHGIDAFLRRDFTGIVVDLECFMEDRFRNRVRFSFAHEVGHYVMHRDVIEQLGMATSDEWKEYMLALLEKEYRSYEWQANEFAGRLLVPIHLLKKEMEKVIYSITDLEVLEHVKSGSVEVLAQISNSLSEIFGVSAEVIGKRIEREGLWPPDMK